MRPEPDHYIYRPYITRKGKRIYRKNGGLFRIPIYKDDGNPS
jgi:hypothetical protein